MGSLVSKITRPRPASESRHKQNLRIFSFAHHYPQCPHDEGKHSHRPESDTSRRALAKASLHLRLRLQRTRHYMMASEMQRRRHRSMMQCEARIDCGGGGHTMTLARGKVYRKPIVHSAHLRVGVFFFCQAQILAASRLTVAATNALRGCVWVFEYMLKPSRDSSQLIIAVSSVASRESFVLAHHDHRCAGYSE